MPPRRSGRAALKAVSASGANAKKKPTTKVSAADKKLADEGTPRGRVSASETGPDPTVDHEERIRKRFQKIDAEYADLWAEESTDTQVRALPKPLLNKHLYQQLTLPDFAEFDPGLLEPDGTLVAVGRRRTGKSFAFRHILYEMRHHFHGGIVISQTDELNKYWRQYIPKQFIYNKYDGAIIQKVFARQKAIMNHPKLSEKEKQRQLKFFIILDDVISDDGLRLDPDLKELFVAGRHYKLFVMLTTQYAKAITPTLRSNADYVLVLRNNNEHQLDSLYKDFGNFLTRAGFNSTMEEHTRDNEILVFDYSKESQDPHIVLNWFKAVDPGPFLLGSKEFWERARSARARAQGALMPELPQMDPATELITRMARLPIHA